MVKVPLKKVSNILTSVGTLNEDFERIEEGFEKTLSRDGTGPNQMEATLDMNQYPIINLPKADRPGMPITYDQIDPGAQEVVVVPVGPDELTHDPELLKEMSNKILVEDGGTVQQAVAVAATPADLLASTAQDLTVGSMIRTADGFIYKVAPADASDAHLTTAGGVKLYVVPGADGVSVLSCGAAGDGVADDTAAIVRAEAVAFSMGKDLCFDNGGTFCLDGEVDMRVSVRGYGAVLQQTNAVKSSAHSAACLKYTTVHDVSVLGLTIDGNLTRSGLYFSGCQRPLLRDVTVRKVKSFGAGFYACSGGRIINCRASEIIYNLLTVPASGGAADGFYLGGCSDFLHVGCTVEDFRRIAFVADLNGPAKSNNIRYISCTARNGHDCDDSTTEYNAGFWSENVNGTYYLDCEVSEIAGNPGQTSGRVVGFKLAAVGSDKPCLNVARDCRVYGGNGYLTTPGAAFSVGGTGRFNTVIIENCYAEKARVFVSLGGNVRALILRDSTFTDLAATGSGHGLLVIDGGGNPVDKVVIDNVVLTNATFSSADAALLNVFSAPSNCEIIIRNVSGNHPIVSKGAVQRLAVENCEFRTASTTFAGLVAQEIIVDGSRLTQGSGTRLFSLTGSNNKARIVNSFLSSASAAALEIGGTNAELQVLLCLIDGITFQFSATGNFIHRYDGCDFRNFGSNGAIRTNFNNASREELFVTNCRFSTADVSYTPIRAWNSSPDFAVLTGNVYNTTALDNLTGAGINRANNFVTP